MRSLLRTLMFLLLSLPLASVAGEVEMADMLRSNGKIYVVVGVIAIIFIGIVIYLITLDRRLSKMEREEKNS